MSQKPVILADSITTVTTGPAVGLRGERIQRGVGAKGQARQDFPIEVFCAASGAAGSTATVVLRVSPDASSWTTWGTLSFTIPSSGSSVALNRVGKLTAAYDYIQASVSAVSGATIKGYVIRKDA